MLDWAKLWSFIIGFSYSYWPNDSRVCSRRWFRKDGGEKLDCLGFWADFRVANGEELPPLSVMKLEAWPFWAKSWDWYPNWLTSYSRAIPFSLDFCLSCILYFICSRFLYRALYLLEMVLEISCSKFLIWLWFRPLRPPPDAPVLERLRLTDFWICCIYSAMFDWLSKGLTYEFPVFDLDLDLPSDLSLKVLKKLFSGLPCRTKVESSLRVSFGVLVLTIALTSFKLYFLCSVVLFDRFFLPLLVYFNCRYALRDLSYAADYLWMKLPWPEATSASSIAWFRLVDLSLRRFRVGSGEVTSTLFWDSLVYDARSGLSLDFMTASWRWAYSLSCFGSFSKQTCFTRIMSISICYALLF